MEGAAAIPHGTQPGFLRRHTRDLVVLLFAAVVYAGCMLSPPSLLDDVDAVQAQIARTMLQSGDWVTARLDGLVYLEKAPLPYWLMAISFRTLGVHDWAARIWVVLVVIALCLVTARFGRWAFGEPAGFYAGLALATCIGLWLFTRILIPDAALTLTITLALWGFLRALEQDEPHPRRWALIMWASVGVGLLLKGLIAVVFPGAAAFLYLVFIRQLFRSRTWQRLSPALGIVLMLGIALPWHVLATLRNPPYFDLTWRSVPGEYHGFFWFYFLNEHVFRFLNMRYPRDYNTVPRWFFWVSQLIWLFPWSVFLPAAARLHYRPVDRAGRARLLALCWIGFVMFFFTLSTTQEYYSMPIYPAAALLIGSAIAAGGRWIEVARNILAAIASICALAAGMLLCLVRRVPTPGDIASALASKDPATYTLSLGHMGDLTLRSFAYLRAPLLLAGVAFLLGALALWTLRRSRFLIATALMMVLLLHAARMAMAVFEPFLSSRPLAEALGRAPQGQLIVDEHYYIFSSVFFYTDRTSLLLNGRFANVEYGSYAPGAPHVFINDAALARLWQQPARCYLVTEATQAPRLRALVGESALHVVRETGGKLLLTNLPLAAAL